MEKKYHTNISRVKIFSDELTNQNINSDFKKVDINILLNRVKVDNSKDKKKNIAFIFFILLGLISSAYLIF
tara:strand:+ start:437 stop:649 length:213 start_codon:yes stop_codon:yes gene_type:complete